MECGLLYKLGRIDRIPMETKADALEFGTVIHIVLGEFYEAKMVGDKMTLRDVHFSFQSHWHR
ncbi:PD-(D/E)XK nuclease family protein, partial [Thermodesulfobacteriota bacterium]